MHAFAVLAFAASASAAAVYGEYAPAANSTVVAPVYAASTPAGYAMSSVAAYPVSSKAPEYSTSVVHGLTTVCSEATTLTVGTKTYVATKPTTIIDNDCTYTTSIALVASTPVAGKPISAPVAHASSVAAIGTPPAALYPSKNGTAPVYGPGATGTSAPTGTKPSASQFTGAAAQTGAAMLAIVGAVAAFL
jgi:hypothetical protein